MDRGVDGYDDGGDDDDDDVKVYSDQADDDAVKAVRGR